MLRSKRFDELLTAFSAPTPTPGGGSAAALAGALGVSLLAMVAGLPKARRNEESDRAALGEARAALAALQDRLLALADDDSAAYDEVVAAFRRPKDTDEQKAARSAAIQAATRTATEVPLSVMRAAGGAIGAAACVASHGNPSAASDVRVGLDLLGAALRGAGYNVEINLAGLKDAALVDALREEMDRLLAEGAAGAERARASLTA
jgi:formiminotetrahydrofolate cyclodeaminase